MKISTKGRYGLRAMVDLAVRSNGDHVSLNSIAESQSISENYLEQVFSSLRKGGFVRSVKGAQGGYTLAHKTSETKVGDILRALEGNLCIIDVDAETSVIEKNGIQHCIKIHVWDKLNAAINDVVDSITLEDLVNEYKTLHGSHSLMFYI